MSEQIVDLIEAVMPGPRGGVTSELEALREDTRSLRDQAGSYSASASDAKTVAAGMAAQARADKEEIMRLGDNVRPHVFPSVADMVAEEHLRDGMDCITGGFGDAGGGAVYKVRAKRGGDVTDGFSLLQLHDPGLVAELVSLKERVIDVRSAGAVGDGVTDDTAAFEHAFAVAAKLESADKAYVKSCVINVPLGKYRLLRPLRLNDGVSLIGVSMGSGNARQHKMGSVLDFSDAGIESGACLTVGLSTIRDIDVVCGAYTVKEHREYQGVAGKRWYDPTTLRRDVDGIRTTWMSIIENVRVNGASGKAFDVRHWAKLSDCAVEESRIGFWFDYTDCVLRNSTVFTAETGIHVNYRALMLVECVRMDSIMRNGIEMYASNNVINDVVLDWVGGNGIALHGGNNQISNYLASRVGVDAAIHAGDMPAVDAPAAVTFVDRSFGNVVQCCCPQTSLWDKDEPPAGQTALIGPGVYAKLEYSFPESDRYGENVVRVCDSEIARNGVDPSALRRLMTMSGNNASHAFNMRFDLPDRTLYFAGVTVKDVRAPDRSKILETPKGGAVLALGSLLVAAVQDGDRWRLTVHGNSGEGTHLRFYVGANRVTPKFFEDTVHSPQVAWRDLPGDMTIDGAAGRVVTVVDCRASDNNEILSVGSATLR